MRVRISGDNIYHQLTIILYSLGYCVYQKLSNFIRSEDRVEIPKFTKNRCQETKNQLTRSIAEREIFAMLN